MEELSERSSDDFTFPFSHIRSIESELQAQIRDLEKQVSEITICETSVCENVTEKILNSEDEFHLSKVQNNYRRIDIASDLLLGICSVHSRNVDLEFKNTVYNLLDVEKYKSIIKRMKKKRFLESQLESFFVEEAQRKILKHSEDERDVHEVTKGDATAGEVTGREVTPTPQNTTELPVHQETEGEKQETVPVTAEAVEFLPETSSHQIMQEDPSERELTQIREGSTPKMLALETERAVIPAEGLSHQLESSIEKPHIQQQMEQDLSHILQMLEDHTVDAELPTVHPESLVEAIDKEQQVVENVQKEVVEHAKDKSPQTREICTDLSEVDEPWSLSSVEPTEFVRKKRRRLIVDEETKIPNYASRAVHLNKNIIIERIQVYEGPPRILKAFSSENLMKTPGFRRNIFDQRRSCRLNELFTRQLKVEKKPHQHFSFYRDRTERPLELSAMQVQRNADFVEEYGVRMGMHSLPQGREVLSEVQAEKSLIQELNLPMDLNLENLREIPLPRVSQISLEPLQMNRISAPQLLRSPRAHQRLEKTLEPKISSPSFISTKTNPPSSKWREFKYVLDKLQNYWTLCEMQGVDKSITVRELLEDEGDDNLPNFLTLLRIVDKLSIRRKLVLTYVNDRVIIRPLERPYLTERQCLLLGSEPKF